MNSFFKNGKFFLVNNIFKLVAILFVFIISTLSFLIIEANYITNTYSSRNMAINEIIIETTNAHLWFEELISGDESLELQSILDNISNSNLYVNALIKKSELKVAPLTNPKNQIILFKIKDMLEELKTITYKRYNYYKISKPGTAIDQEYDKLFLKIIDKLNILKTIVKNETRVEKDNFEFFQYIVILLELISFSTVSLSIFIFTKDREDLISKLEASNITLEEKVKDRTTELQDVISELKTSQLRAIESEKLASLGGLVAGVAHEINTPIGSSYTAITHLQTQIKQISDVFISNKMTKNDLEEFLMKSEKVTKIIKHSLENTLELTKSFKRVSLDQTYDEKRVIILNEYFNEILLSLNPIIKKSRLVVDLDCNKDISVKTSPAIFVQILTNLIQNSVIHGFKDIKNPKVYILVNLEDTILSIIYKDNGIGIKKDDKEKIFEPFFTTNRESGGSGLGLNILHNIVVSQLFGSLECESKINEGVVFTIKIPRKNLS